MGSLDIPIFDPKKHEILLYIGCTSSYDPRAQQIALSLVKVFQASGVRFGYLGEDEPCCGESVLSVGHLQFFNDLAEHAVDVFNEQGVTDIVTISPHCYDVFKNHYSSTDWQFSPFHYTQYLERLRAEGRLCLSTAMDKRVTYQDPCYLGRHNNEYNAPRALINAIAGIEFIEMEECGTDGLCCGGGGGKMWLETEAGERLSDSRVRQATGTDADCLITACPFCVVCLEDSIKSISGCKLQVLDLAEFVAQAL
jgi:Fe-S oxidoreductase